MKRYIVIAALLLAVSGFVCAQENDVGGPDPAAIGNDTAQQQLKEISVDKFEIEGSWHSTMSTDTGYTVTRLFKGNPLGKEPVPGESDMNIPDAYVLGTRVDFLRRGHTSFTLYPTRPIPIEGVTKTLSVWAVGRNFNHDLVVLIQDFFGRTYELYMGKLNFQGWKKLTVSVPPQADDGINGVVQRNYHFYNQGGIKIIGFRVDVDPMEAQGTYYIYLDDLRAVTDLFSEDNRDPDDMSDDW
jgi:hypothetical protein